MIIAGVASNVFEVIQKVPSFKCLDFATKNQEKYSVFKILKYKECLYLLL